MWASEQEAGVALRALQEEPAPPVATTLEQVMRRGRRRVRGQRLGVLAVVVAVLAAGAGGALALWSPDPAPAPEAAELSTTYQWPEQLTGWSVVEPAHCGGPNAGSATGGSLVLARDVLEPAFVAAVAEVTSGPANLVASNWGPKAYLDVEVPVDKSWGSVHLEAGVALYLPAAAADADVGMYGFCAPPLRRTLENGTMLQLYAPDTRSPFAPVQHLRTYLPNGRVYALSSAGWSRADAKGGVVSTGRGKLPLDSQQLADLAVRIAQLE